MSIAIIGPPAVEPVSTAEAKRHLRVESAAEDGAITSFIVAARVLVEAACGRALIHRRVVETRMDWPVDALGRVALSLGPLAILHEARSVPNTGAATPIVGAAVEPGADPALISGVAQAIGPQRTLAIEYTAGYGAAATDVPTALRQAVLMAVAALYAGRQGEVAMGPSALALIAPFKRVRL
jgi:uncharacterized phiE125 gp8 family phage protein